MSATNFDLPSRLPPMPPITQAQPQPQPAHPAPINHTGPTPPHLPAGPHASPQLQELCNSICTSKANPPTQSRLGSRLRRSHERDLPTTLENAIHSDGVVKLSGNAASLMDKLKVHQGPVIVLGKNGLPQYVFERVNGQWQGYTGRGFQPLTPGTSPEDLLEQMDGFQAYSLTGWKPGDHHSPIVIQPDYDRHSNDTDSHTIRRRHSESFSDIQSLTHRPSDTDIHHHGLRHSRSFDDPERFATDYSLGRHTRTHGHGERHTHADSNSVSDYGTDWRHCVPNGDRGSQAHYLGGRTPVPVLVQRDGNSSLPVRPPASIPALRSIPSVSSSPAAHIDEGLVEDHHASQEPHA